jgi:hypothetical protein
VVGFTTDSRGEVPRKKENLWQEIIIIIIIAEYTLADHKTNAQIAKELNVTPVLDKIQDYKRNWIQHVNRMPRNRLPRLIKNYIPKGRRNQGGPLKRLLDV